MATKCSLCALMFSCSGFHAPGERYEWRSLTGHEDWQQVVDPAVDSMISPSGKDVVGSSAAAGVGGTGKCGKRERGMWDRVP
mmetsp:Transcript_37566/g.77124  ORF Transcript_37566/g.77124 Transcript_37566/m.77124 type:complete len:82 (+) Transcript_37566:957-1202(+)